MRSKNMRKVFKIVKRESDQENALKPQISHVIGSFS